MTVEPPVAVDGTEMLVVTSANGEMAVVPLAVSGRVLGPCEVVVEICVLAVTAPVAGAVNVKPRLSAAPLARLPGIPVRVTTPLPLSYEAVTPGGSDGKETPPSPGARVSV